MANKTFLLGVGAQKAGTTWLHSQLCKNAFFHPGFTKEYHTFDSIYAAKYVDWVSSWIHKLSSIDETLPTARAKKASLLKRLLFVYEPDSYFEYFKKLSEFSPRIQLVGDITPSYSMLDTNAFAYIKNKLESVGLNVKVVFLMRDPVERVWSAKRMKRRHAVSTGKTVNSSIETSLLRTVSNQGSRLKTDYQRVINNLENIFEPNDIFYGFFEELFTQASYERFREFINLDLIDPDYNTSINASPKDSDISEELAIKMCQSYNSTYTYINSRFNGAAERLWNKHYKLSQRYIGESSLS